MRSARRSCRASSLATCTSTQASLLRSGRCSESACRFSVSPSSRASSSGHSSRLRNGSRHTGPRGITLSNSRTHRVRNLERPDATRLIASRHDPQRTQPHPISGIWTDVREACCTPRQPTSRRRRCSLRRRPSSSAQRDRCRWRSDAARRVTLMTSAGGPVRHQSCWRYRRRGARPVRGRGGASGAPCRRRRTTVR